MKKAERILWEAVLKTEVLRPVDSGGAGGSAFVLCRQTPGQEPAWLKGLLKLHLAAKEAGLSLHTCRNYVLKGEELAFGWRIEIIAKGSKELLTAVEALLPAFELIDYDENFDSSPPPKIAKVASQLHDVTEDPDQPTPVKALRPGVPPMSIRKVMDRRDSQSGVRHVEEEVPLANMRADVEMNQPSEPKWNAKHGKFTGGGRGAFVGARG